MREAAFVKQNKNKWFKFESYLRDNAQYSPDDLSNLYIEITDDLSYAQTFYPNSNTTKYLNQISVKAHQKIYKTQKTSGNKIVKFYTKEFPLMFYQYRYQLLLAFLVFLFFSLVGAYSAATDQDFVRLILGDNYVNMTLENINNNDPMAVYKKANETDMFIGITINNVRVGFLSYIFGFLLGIGALFIGMQNAVMLGSFQYFFADKGLLWESARTIWIHGTIEISVIIVCICAGLVAGNGIMFPKTYTRLESLARSAKAGLKIVLSTVPFFIIAGFLEGFVTRHTEMPDALAIFIIGGSMALILFYYVFLPIKLHKNQHNGKP
ncbi:stage II sporulation protein M [Mesohalobacter halotolerans]|jgi:uncharacterized membrane protein SpoIIM required for sporulation|uniref:Stage II sporulation protein M n=1 Tax=Mesohalobacter halotolerans TaxID=1883405 RepID=A0A4U5TS37_9FLAO|nr:stage II sporulation protein M [Mesohalobacter halotolerans]MBS3737771.1 stage II sporulation protein M [Psychroflexus sp.]NBC58306.1 stage II sporulation protein M [Bacteroidota bacterium]TKS56832.1 stage II sporulation protein M [Mesohalobacter halotolerans]